jgi:hypothetical protein
MSQKAVACSPSLPQYIAHLSRRVNANHHANIQRRDHYDLNQYDHEHIDEYGPCT